MKKLLNELDNIFMNLINILSLIIKNVSYCLLDQI